MISNIHITTVLPPARNKPLAGSVPKIKLTYEVSSDVDFTYAIIKYAYYSISGDVCENTVTTPKSALSGHLEYFFEYPSDTSGGVTCDVSVYSLSYALGDLSKVYHLTERLSYPKLTPATHVSKNDFYKVFLKAVCNFNPSMDVYCTWEVSKDGIHFTPLKMNTTQPLKHVKSLMLYTDIVKNNLDLENADDSVYIAKPCYKLEGVSEQDSIDTRCDILRLDESIVGGSVYSFRIFTVKPSSEEHPTSVGSTEKVKCDFEEDLLLDRSDYTVITSASTELVQTELPVAASQKLFYSGSTAMAYGSAASANNILVSNPGELVTPLSRVIDLPAHNNAKVTAIAAWRDYYVASTASEMFLISKSNGYFTTKVISTFIGVPEVDGKCFKATANGLIFKSHNKVYMYYPSMYSSDESILNLTDISDRIEDLIVEYPSDAKNTPFALSTESAYYLVMPSYEEGVYTTKCLKYTYNTRVWTYFEYPALLTSYNLKSVTDIAMYGYTNIDGNVEAVEFKFESDRDFDEYRYGDVLTVPTSFSDKSVTPIPFELDSGQKTDSLNYSKHFVETKFNVVTLNEKDCFPMSVVVHVDGCPHITTKDVHTDSAFWKQDVRHVGTLGTSFVYDEGSTSPDIFNVFRQMFLRYSGKGKSIRHIIKGESQYPFKIYEIDYRYRKLNTKQ
jgi:hypothetical protein